MSVDRRAASAGASRRGAAPHFQDASQLAYRGAAPARNEGAYVVHVDEAAHFGNVVQTSSIEQELADKLGTCAKYANKITRSQYKPARYAYKGALSMVWDGIKWSTVVMMVWYVAWTLVFALDSVKNTAERIKTTISFANYDSSLPSGTRYDSADHAVGSFNPAILAAVYTFMALVVAIGYMVVSRFDYVARTNQPVHTFRWLGRALSRSFLIVVIAWVVGIQDVITTTLLFLLAFAYPMLRYFNEVGSIRRKQLDEQSLTGRGLVALNAETISLTAWDLTAEEVEATKDGTRDDLPVFKDVDEARECAIFADVLNTGAWGPYAAASALHLAMWIVILVSYGITIVDAPSSLPLWVHSLLWTTFILEMLDYVIVTMEKLDLAPFRLPHVSEIALLTTTVLTDLVVPFILYFGYFA